MTPIQEERRPSGNGRRSDTLAAGQVNYKAHSAQDEQARFCAADRLLDALNRNFIAAGGRVVTRAGEIWSFRKFMRACGSFAVITGTNRRGRPAKTSLSMWWLANPSRRTLLRREDALAEFGHRNGGRP
jgi:hypothetical protein